MSKANNNQVLAAKLLGISRNTLRDRLEKYSINGQ
jgi:DNA-binding protein Fis